MNPKTYEQGLADGRAESAETLRKLQDAFDKAMKENLALREAAKR